MTARTLSAQRGGGETAVIRLRLSDAASPAPFGSQFNQIIEERRGEADAFYQAITPARVGEDAARVMRQALAGMLWSKQYFFYDTDKWLDEHGADPTRPSDPPGSQPRMVPLDRRQCHLDAGQMGISMVRRLVTCQAALQKKAISKKGWLATLQNEKVFVIMIIGQHHRAQR